MDTDTLLAIFMYTDDADALTQLGGTEFSNETLETALGTTALDPGDPKAIAFWTGCFARLACDPDSNLQAISYGIYHEHHWLKPVADRVFTDLRGAVPDSLQYAFNNA